MICLKDLFDAVRLYPVWVSLGWFDIKMQYRRTVVGPFWIAIASIVITISLGLLYSQLFGIQINDYFPYLSCGLVLWNFIASFISEGPNIFINSGHLSQLIRLPYNFYLLKHLWNKFIIFAHNSTAFFIVLIFFKVEITFSTLLFIPGLLLIIIFGWWISVVLAVFCMRFRDMGILITVIVQMLFFFSPIFWRTDQLGDKMYFVIFNPIYYMLDITRTPLIGGSSQFSSWIIMIMINIIGCFTAVLIFSKYKRRLAYWL